MRLKREALLVDLGACSSSLPSEIEGALYLQRDAGGCCRQDLAHVMARLEQVEEQLREGEYNY
jgi:hypothetical protein